MVYEAVKARLNLNAVLRNLENLYSLDGDGALSPTLDYCHRFQCSGRHIRPNQFSKRCCTYQTPCRDSVDVKLFSCLTGI